MVKKTTTLNQPVFCSTVGLRVVPQSAYDEIATRHNVRCLHRPIFVGGYLLARTQKSFAGGQFALEPEQQRQAVESWTAARLEKFRQGFTGADEWQNAARAFRVWTKAAPKQPAAP